MSLKLVEKWVRIHREFHYKLCYAHPVDILFDSSEVLGPISQGKWPNSIQLNVVSGSGPPPASPDPTAVQLLMGSLFEHAFITYFENNRALMKAKHGAVSRWPDALAFGRIVRHAFAHRGKVHIVDGSTVAWGNLTYSPAENGRRVLYNDLSSGDLTLLMIEMDSEF